MPYVAMLEFHTPYGSFTAGKELRIIRRPPKSTIATWVKDGLIKWIDDKPDTPENPSAPVEYTIDVPILQEQMAIEQSQEPTQFVGVPTGGQPTPLSPSPMLTGIPPMTSAP